MILRGEKGQKQPKPPVRTPDSLRSEDSIEVILGVSEGPIKGLADGAKSFFVGDTPLVSAADERNFEDFELLFYPGTGIDEIVKPTLGGFSNSTSVGIELAYNTPVVRTGQQRNIDFIEIRLGIQALYRATEKGDTFGNTLKLQLQYKPTSAPDSAWLPAYTTTYQPGDYPTIGHFNGEYERFSGVDYNALSAPNVVQGTIRRDSPKPVWQSSAPSSPSDNQLWFDSSAAQLVVKQWNGSQWEAISSQPSGQIKWSFVYKGDPVTVYTGSSGKAKTTLDAIAVKAARETYFWLDEGTGRVLAAEGMAWRDVSTPVAPIGNGEISITGKTTSTYVKELRWGVPRVDDTYDIRLVKLSPDPGQNGDTENFIIVGWESFQEVVAGNKEFPFTAMFQLVGTASDQLSGLPQFSSICDGRVVAVPSNYDAEAKTYSGLWDGTFQMAWTDNPAWIWYDVQVNDRYGVSSYYPVVPNKWDIYEAAKWCDEQVPDGQGGTHPRWTFNQWVTDAQGVKEFSRYLAGVFLGVYTDDGEGGMMMRIDKDANAVALFTPENVVDGKFNYSFTDIQTRYNDITVTFRNPQLNYEEDRVRIRDEAHIAKYGRISTDVIAFGCRNRQEGIRRGRARMIAATTEFTSVSFTTNRLGLNFDLYDVILIADPKLGYGISGRVGSFVNEDKTLWSLLDPVYLEPGVAYSVNVQVPNPGYVAAGGAPFKVEKRSLQVGHPTGSVSVLQLEGPALDLPEHAWFAIEAPDYAGVPKPFRVMGVDQPTGDPDNVTVVCLEVNRNKWAFIDTGVNTDVIDYSSFTTKDVKPPTEFSVLPGEKFIGGVKRPFLKFLWNRSESPQVRRYNIYESRNGDGVVKIGETRSTEFEYFASPNADYVFMVTAVSITGEESLPATYEFSFVGDFAPVEPTSGLRIENSNVPGRFDVRSPAFVWG